MTRTEFINGLIFYGGIWLMIISAVALVLWAIWIVFFGP